jgi:ribose transport system permease protein
VVNCRGAPRRRKSCASRRSNRSARDAAAHAAAQGGSLHGGEGSVIGTLIGALIMELLSNGSDLLGISPYVQQAIIGGVIILAVTVDELRKRRGRAEA